MDSQSNHDKESLKRLSHYTREGGFSAAGSQIVNSYSTPLALSFKATHYEVGLLSSLQSFAGMIALIPGAKILERLHSRKTVWLFSSILYRLFWIPLILLPFFVQGRSESAVYLIIISLALSHFFIAFRYPAWSSLMADVVPRQLRGRFFGRRNMITGVFGLLAILAAGQVLILFGFGWLFLLASAVGFIAVYFIRKIQEPPFKPKFFYKKNFSFSLGDISRSIAVNRNFFVFTLFIFALHFSVRFTSPFFTVYMLQNLGIGYFWFTIAEVMRKLVEVCGHPYWGRLSDRIGEKHLIGITTILITFIPLAWLFTFSPLQAVLVSMLEGFAWSGFDLNSFSFSIGSSPEKEKPRFLAFHHTVKESALLSGALSGGIAAESLKDSSLFWLSGLQILFLLGFFLRSASLVFIPYLKDPRFANMSVRGIFWRVVLFYPARGFLSWLKFIAKKLLKAKRLNRDISESLKTLNYKIRLKRG